MKRDGKGGNGDSTVIYLDGHRKPRKPVETKAELEKRVLGFRRFTGHIESIISNWSAEKRKAAMNDTQREGTEEELVSALVDKVWDATGMQKGPCGPYRELKGTYKDSGIRLMGLVMLLGDIIKKNAPSDEELFNGLKMLCGGAVDARAPTMVKMQMLQSLIVVPGADLDEIAKICAHVNMTRDHTEGFGLGSGVWANLVPFSDDHYLQFSQAVAKKIGDVESDYPKVRKAAEEWLSDMEIRKEELPETVSSLQRYVKHIKTTIRECREYLEKEDKRNFWRGIVERDMGWVHIPIENMDEGEAEVDVHLGELEELARAYPYDATAAATAEREQWEHIENGRLWD